MAYFDNESVELYLHSHISHCSLRSVTLSFPKFLTTAHIFSAKLTYLLDYLLTNYLLTYLLLTPRSLVLLEKLTTS